MSIQEICNLLKVEFIDNGYEYGFFLNGVKYKPDISDGFDNEFMQKLLNEYRVQNPTDTLREKIGTCNDIVILMKSILENYGIICKIWLLDYTTKAKFHTILTFSADKKVVYLELTPQSQKPWYGKEIIYDNEETMISEYKKHGCNMFDVTDEVFVGKAPDFILSRMVR